jgi:excinuclease UvrABC nuclease subunit
MLPGLHPPPGWIHLDWTGDLEVPSSVPRGAGAFLLTTAEGACVQLGGADHLAARLRYYLTRPPPKKASRRRADLSADVRHVWYRPAGSRFEYELDTLTAARAAWPDDYRRRLELRPASFLVIEAVDAFARIVATEAFPHERPALGPFASRAAAGRYCELLEEAAGLCRCRQSRAGPIDTVGCVLRQMGRCDLPGAGPLGADEYRARVQRAFDLGAGISSLTDELTREMNAAAAALQFERAARLKARLDQAAQLRSDEFRWVGPFQQRRIAVVEPASRPGSWVAFELAAGGVRRTEPFATGEAGERLAGLLRQTQVHSKHEDMAYDTAQVLDEAGLFVRRLMRPKFVAVPIVAGPDADVDRLAAECAWELEKTAKT